jgi:phosphatidate cytidylyltransferase
MNRDPDPPTFDFGAPRRRRERAQPPPELEPEVEGPGEGEGEEPGAGDQPSPDEEPRRPRFRLIRSETGRRVLWVIPWIAFAIFIVAVGDLVFTIAMVGLGVLGLRELFGMTERLRPLLLPAFAVLAAMVLTAHYGDPFDILLAFACLFPAMFVFAAAREAREGITLSIAITVLGVAWMGTAFSHAVLLRDLELHGGALLIDVLVATFLADTAAYAGGRMFGSRKITPRISPNKTLEGLISGFLGATLGFWVAGLYQDWLPGIDALLMGMAIGLIAPIGDLFVSMIKRDLEVKDTGSLFGPHGGLLDRLDAVLFTVVAGYYLSVAFVY